MYYPNTILHRNGKELKKNWKLTKEVLLKDIRGGNYGVIVNAVYAFIGIGREEMIPVLIRILNTEGDKTMAEAFLNCGHSELNAAAREWAVRHGYTISPGSGAHPVSWGGW